MTAEPTRSLPLRGANGAPVGGASTGDRPPGDPPPGDRPPGGREMLRIVASLTAACALGAAILGAVYVATARYEEASRERSERRAVADLLALEAADTVIEIRQFLDAEGGVVVYRTAGPAAARPAVLAFTLDGAAVSPAAYETAGAPETEPLGRLFVALRGGRPAGFVIEGESPGYKNVIRFLIALDERFEVAGVRVVQHEEDPGLGAEIATAWFGGQFIGRRAADLPELEVARVPMPDDWREALETLRRVPSAEWLERHDGLVGRERAHPIYAVTGATISSRALTSGIGVTVERFRRRWALLAPHFEPGGRS